MLKVPHPFSPYTSLNGYTAPPPKVNHDLRCTEYSPIKLAKNLR